MEMIIMLAVIAALIALVYWKNVKNDVSVSAGQRPEEQEVTAKLDYFSEATGWHATFYNGSVLCHGVFVNLSEGQGRSGVSLPAVVVGKPEGDREFYSLRACKEGRFSPLFGF